MSTREQPSEEELQAAYEAEIKQIRVEQILLEQVVSMVNLGMRRTGLSPGTEDERDVGQVRVAIEAVRALLPLIEQSAPPQAAAIRDALSQLQLAFVRLGGPAGPGTAGAAAGPSPASGGPGAGGGGPGAGSGGPGGGGPGPGGPGGGPPSPRPGAPASEPPGPGEPGPGEPGPGEPGPAQRSGRLWVPGQ
jgi:hypothetical protein